MDRKVAYEVWTGNPVDFNNLRIFGCLAFVHISNDERSKLVPKSKKCVFVGYSKGVKGFKFWDPISKKMVINKDAVFDEQFILLEIVKTNMPMFDGASPNSVEVQVDFEQLLVIPERVKPCRPRPEATTPHLSLDW